MFQGRVRLGVVQCNLIERRNLLKLIHRIFLCIRVCHSRSDSLIFINDTTNKFPEILFCDGSK